MRAFRFLFIALCFSSMVFAQTGSFGITFSGFVKTDVFMDTHEMVSLREGHFSLYPANDKLDANNELINGNTSLNMLSIQTRLIGKITGPDVLGAKTSGHIEGEFFGNVEGDINGFRLRHAFTKLEWESTSLLIGQYWHPMFITESFPEVISFNTGAIFQPFSRNPQIRVVQKFGDFSITGTLASQRDFSSPGPDPADYKKTVNNSSFLRNSSLPIANLSMKYIGNGFLFGGGVNYLKVKPRLVTDKNIKTDESLSSVAFQFFARVNVDAFTAKLEGVYGENMFDLTMLGGYGVSSRDTTNGIAEYSAIKVLSTWAEFIYGTDWKAGLFFGFTKNLGSDKDITGPIYSRGSDIAQIIRISPRISYTVEKVMFALEFEHTIASYGKITKTAEVEDTKNVSNSRILFATFLYF